jgi:hypothetical protein
MGKAGSAAFMNVGAHMPTTLGRENGIVSFLLPLSFEQLDLAVMLLISCEPCCIQGIKVHW